MSQDSSFLKTTLETIETDPEVKSFIYQQTLDFNPFVTPETLVVVLARDPGQTYDNIEDESAEEVPMEEVFNYRIAIVLKDGDSSIEAEAYHNDIFDAIRLAKEQLLARLIEIQEEIENPQDRLSAIKDAQENKQIH